jgi:hypothetical protein
MISHPPNLRQEAMLFIFRIQLEVFDHLFETLARQGDFSTTYIKKDKIYDH